MPCPGTSPNNPTPMFTTAFPIHLQDARRQRRASGFLTKLLFAFLSACCILHAQSVTSAIEGRVQDPVSGDYLLNARVEAVGTGKWTLTDATGSYRLGNLPDGEVNLAVSYSDYDVSHDAVPLRAGETVVRNYSLTNRARYGATDDKTLVLDEFVVTASREMEASAIAAAEQRYSPNLKNVMAADAFGDVSEGNVGEFLKRMPGVSINYAEGDANNVTIRGFGGEHTGITIDGNAIASGSSSVPSRLVDLEQIAVSNTSRLEVIKTVLPKQWANSLGGTVNLVSKSSFERSRPLFTARTFVQFTNDDHSLDPTPGPGWEKTSKLRPGFQLSYIMPVSDTFGFTLSGSYSDQFGRRLGSLTTYEFAGSGGSETAPYLRSVRLNDNVRETERQAYSMGFDWKPFETLKLSMNYQYNTLDLLSAPRFVLFNTGANPVSFDSGSTQGRTNAGIVQNGANFTHKSGETHFVSLNAAYRNGDWTVDTALSFSRSDNRYRNLDEGFLKGVNARIPTPTVSLTAGTAPGQIGSIAVTRGGVPVDWTDLNSYRLLDSNGNEQRDGWAENTEVRIDARRDFRLGGRPTALLFGGAVKRHERAREWTRRNYFFEGADGVRNSADDTAGILRDTVYQNNSYGYNWPSNIQWVDMKKFYDLFAAHPEYFEENLVSAYELKALATDEFDETLLALYLQGEIKFFNQRLTVTGGVRYERTDDHGVGVKIDRTAGASLTDPLEKAMAQNIIRGATADVSYDDIYPSIAAIYSFTDKLLLRFGYSRTLGRPELENLIPRITETDTDVDGFDGTLNVRNPALKPWTSDNFDLSLEYYLERNGVVSVGVFRKFVQDPFGSITTPLNDALAETLGYDPAAYAGYRMISTYNLDESSRISGAEANYQQSLDAFHPLLRGLSVNANATFLDLDGPRDSDFSELYEKTANWGFSYLRGPVTLRLNWNHNGRKKTANFTWGTNAAEYQLPRTTVDLGAEYRVSKRFWVFLNARNLTNAEDRLVIESDNTPDYSRIQNVSEWGTKWSVGIRGRF